MRSVQSVRWVVAAAVAEALIGLLALRLACLSAMGVLGFVGLIVAAFVVMSWYCGLGLEYRFEVTALFLGWLALMISGVLLAFVFRRDPLQTRATDHEGEEGERQSHRQETDKHKQRLLPLCGDMTHLVVRSMSRLGELASLGHKRSWCPPT